MKVKRRSQVCLLALSILLASLPVSAITAPPIPVSTPTQIQTNEPFRFGKVDLEVLDQITLLDQRFEKDGLVYHEAALDAYLERVGKSVLAGKEIENVNWKFRALRDPEPNALALPNGSIYVNTGLLALLEEEGQLASVLAHEIVHVTERHTYLHNRSTRKKVLAINIMNTISTWTPAGTAAGLAINLIASISPLMLALSVLGYSREQEKEADLEGLKRVSAAGYEPDALIFIRGQGRVFTKGKTFFSIMNPFSLEFPIVFITIGIVDARTGEVLVFTKPASASKVLKDPKALNKLITKSLKKLPASS
ncbi:MAG: M48 family metallopeptidase [Pyrinomonadaceae bacterium]|nr:M48 family metallopeptidase [Pyrinomonadaceae bacterium]